MKELIKNSGFILIDRVSSSGFIFINFFMLILYYDTGQVGIYNYSVALMVLLSLLMTFVDEKVAKSFFECIDKKTVVKTAIKLKFYLLLTSYTAILSLWALEFIGSYELSLITIMLTATGMKDVVAPYYYVLDYMHQSKKRAIASFIGSLIGFLLQLYLIINEYDLRLVASAHIVGSIIFTIFLIKFYNENIEVQSKEGLADNHIGNEILRKSIPVAVAAAAHIVYMRVDLLMIEHFLSLQDVAVYSLSTQMMSIFIIGIYPIQVSFFPSIVKSYNKKGDSYKREYTKITNYVCNASLLWMVFSIAISSFIIVVYLPHEYAPINEFIYLHMLTGVFFYNVVFRSTYLTISNKTKYLLYSQIMALLINIILNKLLIPTYGLHGAAIATTITTFISLILMNAIFKDTRWLFYSHIKGFIPFFLLTKPYRFK